MFTELWTDGNAPLLYTQYTGSFLTREVINHRTSYRDTYYGFSIMIVEYGAVFIMFNPIGHCFFFVCDVSVRVILSILILYRTHHSIKSVQPQTLTLA